MKNSKEKSGEYEDNDQNFLYIIELMLDDILAGIAPILTLHLIQVYFFNHYNYVFLPYLYH